MYVYLKKGMKAMFDSSNSPDIFDQQYTNTDISIDTPIYPWNSFENRTMHMGNESIFKHSDPLALADKFQMKSFDLHHVQPHIVDSYMRNDGTVVESYLRDGEGNGYLRSNPDETITNNLND